MRLNIDDLLISTWYSALFISIGLMTVNAFFVFVLNDHGLSISALSQYLMLPCLPSNEVAIPLEENNFRHQGLAFKENLHEEREKK